MVIVTMILNATWSTAILMGLMVKTWQGLVLHHNLQHINLIIQRIMQLMAIMTDIPLTPNTNTNRGGRLIYLNSQLYPKFVFGTALMVSKNG